MFGLKNIDRILQAFNNFRNKLAGTTGSETALQRRLEAFNIQQGLLSFISNVRDIGKLVYNSLESKVFQLECERRVLMCRYNY